MKRIIIRQLAPLFSALIVVTALSACGSDQTLTEPSVLEDSIVSSESGVSELELEIESAFEEEDTDESKAWDEAETEEDEELYETDSQSSIPEASSSEDSVEVSSPVLSEENTPTSSQEGENRDASHSELADNSQTESVNGMTTIQISVGDSTFSATLNDSEASRALIAQMPVTYSMADLNSNEKYYYLSESLPTDATRPGQIRAGDIMLYGTDCLVVFYESFSSSYSYTRLGSITDASGLKSALGGGTVSITFRVA